MLLCGFDLMLIENEVLKVYPPTFSRIMAIIYFFWGGVAISTFTINLRYQISVNSIIDVSFED